MLVARLLWILPALLLAIAGSLTKAAFDIRQTLREGTRVTADVIEYETESRAEITYGHVKLDVPYPDGSRHEHTLPLPLSLLYSLEEQDQLQVRVMPGVAQQVVVEEIARAQWRLSLINAGMSLIGAVMLIVGVGAWNRYLKQKGDPAAARATAPEAA